MRTAVAISLLALLLATPAFAKEEVYLASGPDLSPDGRTLLFSWHGDIWSVPIEGGAATALTRHPAEDSAPCFSPDGTEIAFVSDRESGNQVFVMPSTGGEPEQITFDTEGAALLGWYPDGKGLLIRMSTDRSWTWNWRFFRVERDRRVAPVMLFDAAGGSAEISPDGLSVLFSMDGMAWWWKGYRGPRASQVWSYELAGKTFRKLIHREAGARSPQWLGATGTFVFTDMADREGNLHVFDPATGTSTALTDFETDTVVAPTVSRDGKTIVFRHRFDLYRLRPGVDAAPAKITIVVTGDRETRTRARKRQKSASDAAFTKDGLELAFVTGGDLFVMDTVLKEPMQITNTPEDESGPVFLPDGSAILFVAMRGGQGDLCRAERKDPAKYWWQNDEFVVTSLTEDPAHETALSLSPDGKRIAFVRGRGDLVVMNVDGTEERVLVSGFERPGYTWSPTGAWIAYATSDFEFNSDVWITRTDGSTEPINISRHPDSDWNPTWSPDGKVLAFLSRRGENEPDIHYVWLREEDEEETKRERTIEEALAKMKKGRKAPKKPPVAKKEPAADGDPKNEPAPAVDPDPKKDPDPAKDPDPKVDPDPAKDPSPKVDPDPAKDPSPKVDPDPAKDPSPKVDPDPAKDPSPKVDPDPKAPAEPKPDPKDEPAADPKKGDKAEKKDPKPEKKPEPIAIDFDRIHDRVRSISLRHVREGNLFWSPDSKRLAFSASIDGKNGTYTVTFPDDLKPKLMTSTTGSSPEWVKTGNAIRWVVRGVPTVTVGAKSTGFGFDVWQEVDVAGRFAAGFDVAWRIMRDRFYDPRMNNRNWADIRTKYRDAAMRAPDRNIFQKVISMMIGELNASHGGFSISPDRREGYRDEWAERTGHLGIRWDPSHSGPGLRVLDVVPNGPADRKKSRVEAGEIVLAIDGTEVDPTTDLSSVLTGRPDRDVMLRVKPVEGEERTVVLRPTSLSSVRRLLYPKWVRDNESTVTELSKGKLGYLHVRGMSWGSFYEFERQLYAAGYGRDGLVIDVRNNGGGFTADHLLTALTQPAHAYTISRGGGPGYPQDRKVYASWKKPIVVLINQGSFSNAEIFAHAIRTLGRGRLVGVQTAGGVISTGGARVMDFGFIRTPGRGWFLLGDGQDMEQNGARPHVEVWPEPGDEGRGIDRQLDKAVEVLLEDVAEWQKTGQLPKPVRRSERKK